MQPDQPESSGVQTLRVLYRGRVHGVGFRWTCSQIAKRYPVKGYVRNLPDGSVELVVQGNAAAIAGLTGAIAESFRGHISSSQEEPFEAAGEFAGFEVRR